MVLSTIERIAGDAEKARNADTPEKFAFHAANILMGLANLADEELAEDPSLWRQMSRQLERWGQKMRERQGSYVGPDAEESAR